MSPYLVVSLFIVLLPSSLVRGQDNDRFRSPRATFGINGGLGMRQFAPAPVISNRGATILTYKGKPERTGWCGCTYYALSESGEIVEVKFDEYNADLNARLGLFNRRGNGWLFNAAYAFSRYSYAYNNVPYTFKGYTLGVRNSDIESHGISLGIAKFWYPSLFVRLSGVWFYKFTTGGFNKPVNSSYQLNYVENGTGFIVSLADVNPNHFAITPEIGLTSSEQPVELSISATIPFRRYAVTEQYRYYRNRLFVGEADASYSTMTASINVRVGLNLFKRQRKSRTSHQPRPTHESQRQPTVTPDPPLVHHTEPDLLRQPEPSRYEGASTKAPLRLKVYFDLTKATLKTESFTELDNLADWLKANPAVQIRLEGHTDLIGDAYKNLILSKDRVVAVRDYLSTRGIASGQVDLVWFGGSRPLNRDCPPPNYCPENRRVDMVITNR